MNSPYKANLCLFDYKWKIQIIHTFDPSNFSISFSSCSLPALIDPLPNTSPKRNYFELLADGTVERTWHGPHCQTSAIVSFVVVC